ncbi:SAM-dependent methyltransferase [Mycolicibacterium parafortuitum]|uniref:S-adenosyl-L-methionine-dependent methyltransferase n=1 Tax=Mycolicibacterium parafortuitum TaxID=39692 RepID=A0A375YH57_MYCPF|nr:SAM-dependent methyltransferase [Mycolicibacterium parafortuitum]ORB28728.1 SAM-dependent methyltransferase [Mycolicibacterium parafortuitum]SRX80379.1 putative S-adenosylmethionine-dependent methyltransferase [Mycobacterium tuberculosis H37Rv] [Mycolicibacterium parafortuitum]
MSRTEGDTWDLATSVGATATMVAAARAVASGDPDPLIDDPYAAPLVRAVGIEFFTKIVDGELDYAAGDDSGVGRLMTDVMAVRTRFFDDFFAAATAAGIRQAVIVASGLDSRAYRLDWPAGTAVFEIDQPAVIGFKTATLAALGAVPAARLHTVGADLRDDWPAALRAAGFDPGAPTAWIAEGLLVYLPPDAQDRLFDDIDRLSAPGSRLATEYHPDAGAGIGERARALRDQWRSQGFDSGIPDVADLFQPGERTPPAEQLGALGWDVTACRRPEVFARYGRSLDAPDTLGTLRDSMALDAIKTPHGKDQP